MLAAKKLNPGASRNPRARSQSLRRDGGNCFVDDDDDDDDDDDAILAVVESIDTSGNVGGV